MEIRRFEARDAQDASSIVTDCFVGLDLGRHTSRGIQIQLEGNTPQKLIEKSRRISYFVATRQGEVVGICGHDRERVHTLFVRRDCQREGIGGGLLAHVLDHARSEGIGEIRTWSTVFAKEFYCGFGFEAVRDLYLPDGERDIGLIEMVKKLQA